MGIKGKEEPKTEKIEEDMQYTLYNFLKRVWIKYKENCGCIP